jgi:DNA-directed RNA polymerase subunit beta'
VSYILLRPVFVHTVPQDKGFFLDHKFFPAAETRGITLRTVKRIFYKDGEKIKSNHGGVDLLQTFLVLDIKNKTSDLKARLEYTNSNSAQGCKMKVVLYESITVNESLFKDFQIDNTLFVKYLVKANQYVLPNTSIAKIDLLAKTEATLVNFNKTNNNIEFLLLQENSLKTCFYNNLEENPTVKVGDLIRVGTYITNKMRSKYAGQIYQIEKNNIKIRLGRPYLISPGTVLRVGPYSLVEKADMLATLVYEKLKTVDIVQGLPKIEEILEARKIKNACILAPHEGQVFFKDNKIELTKPNGEVVVILVEPNVNVKFTNGSFVNFLEQLTDGPINPHSKLETLFNYFQLQYPVHIACKKSFKKLQLFLVDEVQRTYFSQGVQIADKHIEVIVKQMTSKVRVTGGGDTTLLPGEILDIGQAEIITGASINSNKEPPTYQPMLLGLTKASLNSDSFISAASFQETTRVLTEAAIEGKKDWLNGLKENVIIGRLIPAGTGIKRFENFKKISNENAPNNLIRQIEAKNLKTAVLDTRLA